VDDPPSLPPALPLRSSDPDDQVFIDLAVGQQAGWLFSRDRAILRLARRLRPLGVQALSPAAWLAGQAIPAR
jgi:predicted nucleic acid-binding protein